MSDETTGALAAGVLAAAPYQAGPSFEGAGALISAAFKEAGAHLHAELIDIRDPRDGTEGIAVVTNAGVSALNPSAFDAYRVKPLYRTGAAKHTRLDSFIAHVLRFKADNSAVFAVDDAAAPKLTAIFDYHPEGADNADAQFGHHRAVYAFPLSEEWKAWAKANGTVMSMTDFAAFLEDHIVDVVADAKPASAAAIDFISKVGGDIAGPSKLMEIARTLQVNEASTLREARNLSSGESEILFNSVHLDAAGNKLVVPNLFMICIPVFARSPDYWQILARFRYRKSGGGIQFWFELWRIDLVFEEAFEQACAAVKEQTGLPVFVGAPEA